MSHNEDDLVNEPYFLRSFESPLSSIYHRYGNLWLESEHGFYKTYAEALSRDEKLIFIKLLFRKHDNCYELGEVADYYWRHINWQQNYTEAEIASDKQRVADAVMSLIDRRFLVRWRPEQNDQVHDINVLKSLQLPALKMLLQGLPDGKEALKKYKKKEEMIVWLVQRLQKFGNQKNPFTQKTFSECVWERFHEHNSGITPPDQTPGPSKVTTSVRFMVAKEASTFFKRLHLLSHIFGSSISGAYNNAASSDSIGERVEGILTESLKPSVLEELNAVEYVKCSKSKTLGINGHKPLFETRLQLEAYERALGVVQEIRNPITNLSEAHRLGSRCIAHLIAYVDSERSSSSEMPSDSIPDEDSILTFLRTNCLLTEVDKRQIVPIAPSSRERIRHHVHRRLTPEYLYSITLYELAQLLELGLLNDEGAKIKEHLVAVRWYQLILRVNATRMNRGKIFLRLLVDLRRHLKLTVEAVKWADQAMKEIFELEPGFIVDVAKQISLLIGRRSLSKAKRSVKANVRISNEEVITVKDDDTSEDSDLYSNSAATAASHKPRPMTTFKGIYKELENCRTDNQIDFAGMLTSLEKNINATIPIKLLTGVKLAQPPLAKRGGRAKAVTPSSGESDIDDDSTSTRTTAVINSKFRWNDEWVSVETFALNNYLFKQDDDWIKIASHGFYSERLKVRKRRSRLEEPKPVLTPTDSSSVRQDRNWVGCHCEGSIVRELCSVLLFPLVFNAHVCPENADAFITDAQIASCDLSTTDFYQVRKSAIHAYLTLWQRLESKRELAFLLTFVASQLYEVRVLAATWNLHTNHPNAFRPEDNMEGDEVPPDLPPRPPPIPSSIRPSPSPGFTMKPPRTPMLAAGVPGTSRKNGLQSTALMRKTPTSKWNTPRQQRKRPIVKRVGQTHEINMILGYDRGLILQPQETLQVALERRFRSGVAYGLELSKVACGISTEGLAQIMLHLCKCFPYWSNGLPDLLLWKNVPLQELANSDRKCSLSPACVALLMIFIDNDLINAESVEQTLGLDCKAIDLESWLVILEHTSCPALSLDSVVVDSAARALLRSVWNSVCRMDAEDCSTVFAEVKGPGDQLSQKQRLWLYAMIEAGVNAHVCEVKASN